MDWRRVDKTDEGRDGAAGGRVGAAVGGRGRGKNRSRSRRRRKWTGEVWIKQRKEEVVVEEQGCSEEE